MILQIQLNFLDNLGLIFLAYNQLAGGVGNEIDFYTIADRVGFIPHVSSACLHASSTCSLLSSLLVSILAFESRPRFLPDFSMFLDGSGLPLAMICSCSNCFLALRIRTIFSLHFVFWFSAVVRYESTYIVVHTRVFLFFRNVSLHVVWCGKSDLLSNHHLEISQQQLPFSSLAAVLLTSLEIQGVCVAIMQAYGEGAKASVSTSDIPGDSGSL